MRIRTDWRLLICCAALAAGTVLTACTASAPKRPDATVTTPVVGRPPAPVSAEAALSSEAFTPYAVLGAADNDGLAPGDTYDALHTACMNDGGYGQYAAEAPYAIRTNRGLAPVMRASGPPAGSSVPPAAPDTRPRAGRQRCRSAGRAGCRPG